MPYISIKNCIEILPLFDKKVKRFISTCIGLKNQNHVFPSIQVICYRYNWGYFCDLLPDVVITIQSSPKCYGYITTQKIWKGRKEHFHEINIGAEYLARSIENVLATLMHEMVHLYCMVNDIQDTSNGGRYHNKRFKAEAEKRDLKIEHAQYIGYSITSPTESFIEIIRENGLDSDIRHCRAVSKSNPLPPPGVDGNAGKKKSSTRKYVCEHCGISVRATKDVNIICGDCLDGMVKLV